ncbi:MAG: hypothetical protein HRT93_05045 [Piscirickettsiaceae bacterium]|nr:hypothetical protein [Piscirickettsiaceae bacterium]
MNIAMRFIDICLFKAGPADVPSSHWLLKLTLLVYFILGVIVSRLDSAWDVSLFTSLADVLVMMVFVWLILSFRGLQKRYKQTLTAMAGAGSCIGIVGIPIVMLFNQVSEQERLSNYTMLLMIAVMFWSLMVTAHIFRFALEIKPGMAAMLTLAYTILSLIVVALVISGVA